MSFLKGIAALVLSLSPMFCASAFADEDANVLLLRVVLGNFVLSEGIGGEERNGEIYADLSELAEALEEPPQDGLAPVSSLANIFPARFEADLSTQELRVFGRGELGVERRLIAEVGARLNRPAFSASRTTLAAPDEWFSAPFAQATHRITRAPSGEYVNADSLRLFGVFLRGNSSFSVSETDGEFSVANWTWQRERWRGRALFAGRDGAHFVSVGRSFASEDFRLDAGLSYDDKEKAAAFFSAKAESGGVGATLGKRKSWYAELKGELFSAGWNAKHSQNPDETRRSDSRIGFFGKNASGYYTFSRHRRGADSHDARARYFFPLGEGFSGEWGARFVHRIVSESEGEIGVRHKYDHGDARFNVRLSHERSFSSSDFRRTDLLWERRGDEGDSRSVRVSHFHRGHFRTVLNWRSPLLSEQMLLHLGASFSRERNSAYVAVSYTFARDPESRRWRAHNQFSRGALSACAVNAQGEPAAGGPYRLKNGAVLDENGCAFLPFSGGDIALDDAEIPPWISLPQEKFYAKAKPGTVIRARFNISGSGELEGVVRRGETPLPGVLVRMIPAGRNNLPSGVCAGEAQTGAPPPAPEREIRKVRTVFDGGYYFDNIPPGEYIVAAGERWRRVHIAENEICNADLITDNRLN